MYNIASLFCTPVYLTRKDTGLSLSEMEEVNDIINKDLHDNSGNLISFGDTYIFDTKLKKLKEFIEQHIEIYVREIISLEGEMNFYITQSWLILNKPGDSHERHAHPNSIISEIFYVATVENDKIYFYDPNAVMKKRIELKIREFNHYNSSDWFFNINDFDLILFPSWLEHSVEENKKQTTNRISIAFNVFAEGTLGRKEHFNELKRR